MASNAQFKVDAQGAKTGLIAATAQTWSTAVPVLGTAPATPEARGSQTNIWRPQSAYFWLPITATDNGLTTLTGPNAYADFFTGGASALWKKTSETTLYDVYSNALEATDINGKYVATKKGYEQSRVFMTGGPASYNEIVYTGLEDATRPDGTLRRTDGFLSGGIGLVAPFSSASDATIFTDAAQTTGKVHTGTKSLCLKSQKHGLSYNVPMAAVQPDKAYRVSVWANRPEAQVYYWVNGVQRGIIGGTAVKQANGWYLLDLTIPPIGPNNTSFRIGCYNSGAVEAYLDDFRFQPIDAQCTAYVYKESTGQLTDLLNNDNLFTHYQYDAAGRLIKVSRETLKYSTKLVGEYSYQYGSSRPALEEVTLTVSVPSVSRSVQVAVSLPSALSGTSTIQYSPGNGIPYAPVANTAFTYTYAAPGTFWMRVKVTDSAGNQRELVKKVIVFF